MTPKVKFMARFRLYYAAFYNCSGPLTDLDYLTRESVVHENNRFFADDVNHGLLLWPAEDDVPYGNDQISLEIYRVRSSRKDYRGYATEV